MGKVTGGEDDHSLPSNAEVKNEWSYNSTPPPHTLSWLGQGQIFPTSVMLERQNTPYEFNLSVQEV